MSSKGGQMTYEERWARNRQGDAFTARRWISSRSPEYQTRKLTIVWAAMLKASQGRHPKGFAAAAIAKQTVTSPRYVRSYVLALSRAGYLDTVKPHQSAHSPAVYRVNDAYRGDVAPQLAGGSGGGGRLGNGWKAAADRAPIAKKQMPAKRKRK